jgi:hypothetical protein
MRTLCPLLVLLLVYRNAGAQTHSGDYFVLSADAGTFFATHPGHDIATTFPYMVTSTASGGSYINAATCSWNKRAGVLHQLIR